MIVVQQRRPDGVPNGGTSLPPLQPVERPEESTMAGGWKGDGLVTRQMPTRTYL